MKHHYLQKISLFIPAIQRIAEKIRIPNTGLFLILAASFFAIYSSGMYAQGLQDEAEIRFGKAQIQQLFSLKKGSKTRLQIFGKEAEMLVLNHMNQSEKSGAIALIFTVDNSEAKFLINRKERNGKLVYWLAILPLQGKFGYKLESETKDEFVLVRVNRESIVSE